MIIITTKPTKNAPRKVTKGEMRAVRTVTAFEGSAMDY